MVKKTLSFSVFLSAFIYAYLAFFSNASIKDFTIASISLSAVYLVLTYIIIKYPVSPKKVYAFLIAGLLFRLMLIDTGHIASDDIYRYIWDGKVFSAGINPYSYNADDPVLERFHTKDLPDKINHSNYKSIYPPAAQVFFLLGYLIGGDSFLGIKILLLISEILTVIFICLSLKLLDKPLSLSLIYFLSPLPILQFMCDAHIDGLGVMFLSGFIYFYLKNKKNTASGFLGFSIISKLISGMFIPLLFFSEKGYKRLLSVLIPAGILVISYALFMLGNSDPFDFIVKFAGHWMYNGSVFKILHFVMGKHAAARIICATIFLAIWLFISLRKGSFFEKSYYLILSFFLTASTVYPWYLSWILLFLPFYFRWSGVLWVALISLVNIDFILFFEAGIWRQNPLILYAEYVPVFVMLGFELKNLYLRPKKT